MPNEITDGYQIECLSCSYVWNTKYSQISAKCPSCSSRIYGTGNYTVHTRYIHHEKTEEEKRQTLLRVTIGVAIFWIALISFVSKTSSQWFFGLFMGTAMFFLIWFFMIRKKPEEDIYEPNLKGEKSIKISTSKKEIKTTLNCPKCGKDFDYVHRIGKEGNLNLICSHCKSHLSISTDLTTHYNCKYCGKKFDSKIKAENHEKGCEKKK